MVDIFPKVWYNKSIKKRGKQKMMYKTHIKIGQSSYILAIPALASIGVMPNLDPENLAVSALALGVTAVVGFHGASFGSGYPDIDHPTSIPARKSPILAKIFQKFGVKHRGRYSHSVDMITLTFLLLMIGANFLMQGLSGILPETIGAYLIGTGILAMIVRTWVVATYIGALSHLIADSLTKQGVRILFFMEPVKLIGTRNNIAILSVFTLMLTGILPNLIKIKEFDTSTKMITVATALVGIVVSYFFSGIVYDIINGKKRNSKPNNFIKVVLTILFGIITISTFTQIGNVQIMNNDIVKTMIRVISITGFVTSIMPGLDFFKTGDDSTWEKIVRKIFTWLLPLSYVITPAVMVLGLLK